nr:MAG TPA: hypothetical protein [Caudoviricetes sp.]
MYNTTNFKFVLENLLEKYIRYYKKQVDLTKTLGL